MRVVRRDAPKPDIRALLQAHGLRAAQARRPAEIRALLTHLLADLDDTGPVTSGEPAPGSRMPGPPAHKTPGDPAFAADTAACSIAGGDPFFGEPAPVLPEGERTFLRLVAVDAETLFCTLDLSAADRARFQGGARIVIDTPRLDETGPARAASSVAIDIAPGRWSLPAPGPRQVVVARLCTPAGDTVVTSNPAIVPANTPAPAGRAVFVTIPSDVDRATLADGALYAALSDPAPGAVEHTLGVRVEVRGTAHAPAQASQAAPAASSIGSPPAHGRWRAP